MEEHMTDAAEDYITVLKERYDRYDDMVDRETIGVKRAFWLGYRDATYQALQDFKSRREDMEKGTLVPEREEPFTSFSEKVAA